MESFLKGKKKCPIGLSIKKQLSALIDGGRTQMQKSTRELVNHALCNDSINSFFMYLSCITGHVTVYMLGAVGLIFVNSVALATELILKARE